MSDSDTPRRPGPWDAKPDEVMAAPVEPAQPVRPARSAAPASPYAAQNPLTALVATLFLGGLIWYMSGSLVVAVAVVFGVFVHEYGHVLAMNRVGMGPARMHITYFGGLAQPQRPAESEWHGVLVSLAGPVFGLLAALPFFALYAVLGGPVWLVGAASIAALNLINLLPAPPLDGSKALGPVLAWIHPAVERAAIFLVGGLAVLWGAYIGNWFIVVFIGIALVGHMRRGRWRPEGRELTNGETAKSLGLFLLSALACLGVALAALLPLAGGSLPGALGIVGGFFGIGR